MSEIITTYPEVKKCNVSYILAVNDTLNVISGKWKLPIIATMLKERQRFSEIQKQIPKISPRMLSKELRELELNGVVVRTVHNTTPVLIEYGLSDSGKKIMDVLDKMVEWGLNHRELILHQNAEKAG